MSGGGGGGGGGGAQEEQVQWFRDLRRQHVVANFGGGDTKYPFVPT